MFTYEITLLENNYEQHSVRSKCILCSSLLSFRTRQAIICFHLCEENRLLLFHLETQVLFSFVCIISVHSLSKATFLYLLIFLLILILYKVFFFFFHFSFMSYT